MKFKSKWFVVCQGDGGVWRSTHFLVTTNFPIKYPTEEMIEEWRSRNCAILKKHVLVTFFARVKL